AGDKQPGKPAQGFDNVYNNKSSISSSSQASQNEPHQHRGPSPGNSKLTLEEEKALDELLSNIKRNVPDEQARDMERAFQAIKEEGIPTEIREIMDDMKKGKALTLSEAAKLVRMTTQMARKAAERDSSAKFTSPEPEKEAPKHKSGTHGRGPQKNPNE